MSTSVNYTVYEGDNVYNELIINENINVGDTITYETNNQMGYKKYEVIKDITAVNGKGIKEIYTYDDQFE